MILPSHYRNCAMAALNAADPNGELTDEDTNRAVIDGLILAGDQPGRVLVDPRFLLAVYGPSDPVVTTLTLLAELGYVVLEGVGHLHLRYPDRKAKDIEPVSAEQIQALANRWA